MVAWDKLPIHTVVNTADQRSLTVTDAVADANPNQRTNAA